MATSRAHRNERDKIENVMHEFGAGKLHSGSAKGPKVTSRKHAAQQIDGHGISMTPRKRK